ncbi:hypothetical protein [Devosia sp. 919]|nr:hypothetical protein [Devosia sp. 919]
MFLRGNWDFAVCITDAGLWWLADPALLVISTVGALLFKFGPKAPGVRRR